MLRFTKIRKGYYPFPVWEFNLPAGHSCPYANECLTKADRGTGKLEHGHNQKFKCYAAVAERFPNVRKVRWENFDTLKTMTKDEIVEAIVAVFPKGATHVRIHGGGDFFSQQYFEAWLEVCRLFPDVMFWAFTKSVAFWARKAGEIPKNLTMQASIGGKNDDQAKQLGFKFAQVFESKQDAEKSGLPIDTDDTLAMSGSQSFALIDNYAKKPGKSDERPPLFDLELAEA